MEFSLVFDSLWGMRKKTKFLDKERGKFEEFFYLKRAPYLSKKVHKKFGKNFPPKKCHIFCKMQTIFDPPNNFYCIFMHQFFSDIKFCIFFQFLRPILAQKNLHFRLVNSLFSLSVFLARNSLSSNSLIPWFLMRKCHA